MYEIAKLILEHADSIGERRDAIRSALFLGMPLNEIEAYLDWLEIVRGNKKTPADQEDT